MKADGAQRWAAIYALVVGTLMLVMWAVLLLTGQTTELVTEPLRLLFHLAAEVLTAGTLIAGGLGLLRGSPWGRGLTLLGLGMLVYTVIASPGYYAQLGNLPMVGMFAALLALALAVVRPLIKAGEED